MITFQKRISYDGDPANAPSPSITLLIELPIFEYESAAGENVVRRATGEIYRESIIQPLTNQSYSVTVDDRFMVGASDDQAALARQYYLNAARAGTADDFLVTAQVRYVADDDIELGVQPLTFLCVPHVERQFAPIAEKRAMLPQAAMSFIAISPAGFGRLRKQVAGSGSLEVGDALLLGAVSALTVFEGVSPTLRDDVAEDLRRGFEDDARRPSAAGVKRLLNAIRSTFSSLFEFPLVVPEIDALAIGGTLTIGAASGPTVSARDFLTYEISAELTYGDAAQLKILQFRFMNPPTLTGRSATFSLTSGIPIYRNDLRDPVLVKVKSLDSLVWVKGFTASDPTLVDLDIEVPLSRPATLTSAPEQSEREASKRLRGRVLTFNDACVLKDALVLVRAKTATDTPWRIVGAATTDGAGNFSLPYPYGAYLEAQAVVSLAPTEAVDIAITGTGEETISDAFLYLLLSNPNCPAPETGDDCDCHDPGKPNRLPDHADLIGSSAYSQDIGGSCANLSKPNRTINEFNYQAIVRTSDPDVTNYTLRRVETGVQAIDVSLAASLASGAVALQQLTTTARNKARESYEINPSVFIWMWVQTIESAVPHIQAARDALGPAAGPATNTVLAQTLHHLDAAAGILLAFRTRTETEDLAGWGQDGERVLQATRNLRDVVALAIDTVGTSARFELVGGRTKTVRRPVDLTNPIPWEEAGGQEVARLSEAVSVATGHILHYKALFKADGYSLGDLIYSLPLAPGQKKNIVVFDASRTLSGTESQALSQNERLAAGIVDERSITNQLGGSISESLRGASNANTSGISAGLGTGGQGSGGTGAYGGSGSAVIGVAGGVANANSTASADSSRNVAQFFGERLRQSIMQNAEGYRQLNASVVTTVQEGQRYAVTSEVVANHNHCHALTMMYFEVLRHYAIFQQLSSVEECVFVPLLLTRFTSDTVAKWRDVLAPALLPMPSETYLQPSRAAAPVSGQHPLLQAFDADHRIRTHYANVDVPASSYDAEPIRFVRGEMLLRVNLPRPRTRYDRIKSLPVTTRTETSREIDLMATAKQGSIDAVAAGLSGGLSLLFTGPPGTNLQYNTKEVQVQVKQAIFDAFMTLDANYESVPPSQCIRVTNFAPTSISFGGVTVPVNGLDFFQDGIADRDLWTRYARLLEYTDVLRMLDYYFKGRLIAEWDDIFYNDIAPLVFRRIMSAVTLSEINADFTTESRYAGGERLMRVFVSGTTSKARNQLPPQLRLSVSSADAKALKDYVTLNVESVRLNYSTAHYNGLLYSGSLNNDLLDDSDLDIPLGADEKRNPRREDRYLSAKLLDHLNGNLEYYNKALWYRLDPDRRFMLIDGVSIQVFDEDGAPIGFRSLASVVKNEVVAVSGNALVFPVAPGYRVSQSYIREAPDGAAEAVSLFDHYKPLTPSEPYRISVPSRGVFAEAMQGACNACEKIETDRLQDWNRFPITDQPTAIAPVTTPTPVMTDWRAAFRDFAPPMVNIQNAPAAPAPGAGMEGLSELLGRSGVFRDVTGLDANQQNVIRTYLSNQENARAFAQMAQEMAMQGHNTQNSGRIMDSLKSAKDSGALNQADYSALVKDHLTQQIDGGQAKKAELQKEQQTTVTPLTQAAVEAAGKGQNVTAQTTKPGGESESVQIAAPAVTTVASGVGDAAYWADLIRFRVPPDLVTAVTARNLEVQRITDGYGDVNLDWFQIDITQLPNAPGTTTRFDPVGFFDYVRKNFPRFLRPYPRTLKPESLAPYEAADGTRWASADPLGSVMLFTIDANPLPEAAGVVIPIGGVPVPELGLVLCSEYVSQASGDSHWNFTTLKGPAPIGYHPVSGTRQFGLGRKGDHWVFYVRAADRTTTLAEYAGSPLVFSGADEYWDYLQNKMVQFVTENGGSAKKGLVWSRRYMWGPTRLLIFGPDSQEA